MIYVADNGWIIHASSNLKRPLGTPTRTCIESKTDFSSTYHFLFIENTSDRGTCYHCVKIFVRTVNIIEKIESKE